MITLTPRIFFLGKPYGMLQGVDFLRNHMECWNQLVSWEIIWNVAGKNGLPAQRIIKMSLMLVRLQHLPTAVVQKIFLFLSLFSLTVQQQCVNRKTAGRSLRLTYYERGTTLWLGDRISLVHSHITNYISAKQLLHSQNLQENAQVQCLL